MKRLDSKWIGAFLIVLAVASTACFARTSDRSSRSDRPERMERSSRRDRTKDKRHSREDKLKQQEQQSREYTKKVDSDLTNLIKSYNELAFPEKKLVEATKEALFKGKKYLRYVSREDKAKSMLLDSWLSFYGGDTQRAITEAGRAYSTDPYNGDAWASQVVFSVLEGKTPKGKIRPRLRRGEEPKKVADPTIELYMDEAVVSLNGKRVMGISQVFKESQIETDYAAVMFWKLPEFDEEELAKRLSTMKLEEAEKLARQRQQEIDAITKDIQAEMAAFSVLSIARNTKKMEFAAVNVNSEEKRDEVMEFVKGNSAKDADMAKLALGMNISDADLPGDLRVLKTVDRPVLLIVSKSQVIEYAGSARGPLPKLIVQKLVPEVSFKKTKDASRKHMDMNPMMDMMPAMPSQTTKKVTDSNSIPENGGKDSGATKSPAKAKEYRKLNPEEEVEAENILKRAQMFRGSHTRLGQSRKAVEACKEVIKKFPNTVYEEQAKEILRSVPSRHRKKLGITDEEIQ